MKATTHHRDLLVLYWMLFDEFAADAEATSEGETKLEPAPAPSKRPSERKPS